MTPCIGISMKKKKNTNFYVAYNTVINENIMEVSLCLNYGKLGLYIKHIETIHVQLPSEYFVLKLLLMYILYTPSRSLARINIL